MRDVIILTKDESLFTVIAFEREGLGMSIGDPSDTECSLLIVDADSVSDFSLKHRKLAIVTRASESDSKCDLIIKRPVHAGILREGVRSLFSAPEKKDKPKAEKKDKIKLLPEERSVIIGSNRIRLSECEYLVLSMLYEKRGSPVRRAELDEALGKKGGNESDVYICLLRRKLEADGQRRIFTARGVGYFLK